ncbi:MAG: phosphatase PAP2 family protein [Gemmatimonadaceae bacterium]
MRVRRTRLRRALALLALGASGAAAQSADSVRQASQPLFTARDAWVALGTVAGTVLFMATVDEPIARTISDSANRAERPFLRSAAKTVKLVNERSLFAVSAGAWLVGLGSRTEGMSRFGLHSMEAILATAALHTVIKGTAGRARPFITREAGKYDAFDFNPGKGFSDPEFRSMPSLHVGGTMAFATVLSDELDRWRPGDYRWVRPILYTAATLPGFARMYTDKHWTSDVLFGAVSGYLVATKVSRYTRKNPQNRIDRWLLRESAVGAGSRGEFKVGWEIATPF